MQTKLHGWHLKAGARMIDFGGWDMPIQYQTGPREEHLRVRSSAGLFDIDHMGRFEISGPGALGFLQSVQTWDASRLEIGRAHYSLLCSESGGIIDDIFLYHLSDRWLMIVNASNTPKDLAWLQSRSRGHEVRIRSAGDDTCMLALQGPLAREVLGPLCMGADCTAMGFHRVSECAISGSPSILCTTGYTGEPGFEMLVPAGRCERIWTDILEAGRTRDLIPCGLGARDSLRAEACLPLYGHEIDETTDPFTAGLARAAVAMDGHEFIGRRRRSQAITAGLLPTGSSASRWWMRACPGRATRSMRAAARPGGSRRGCAARPRGASSAWATWRAHCAETGTEVRIIIRDTAKAARIVKRPFYTSPHWR